MEFTIGIRLKGAKEKLQCLKIRICPNLTSATGVSLLTEMLKMFRHKRQKDKGTELVTLSFPLIGLRKHTFALKLSAHPSGISALLILWGVQCLLVGAPN